MTLAQAWEAFDKAVRLDEKARDPQARENLQNVARKGADRKLDEAVALEAEAIAAGERHG